MTTNATTFHIDTNTTISIDPDIPLKMIHCCTEASLFFSQNNTPVVISTDSTYINMQALHQALAHACAKKRYLHPSLTNDLGCLYNIDKFNFETDSTCDATEFITTKLEKQDIWVGMQYLMWNDTYTTWLYNDSEGAIIFEIAPKYLEFYSGKDLTKSAFESWLQTYKPFYKTVLHEGAAQEWLGKSEQILVIIENNIAHMRDHDKF